MSRVRATGLTFAPEAGTQRMRDVINKNVTEEDITASAREDLLARLVAHEVYFMIGLPTETTRTSPASRRPAGGSSAGGEQDPQRRRRHRLGQLARAQAAHAVSVVRDGLDRRASSASSASCASVARDERVDAQVSRRRRQPRRGHPVARRSPARRRHRARLARRRALRRLGRALLARALGRGARRVRRRSRELYLRRVPSTRGCRGITSTSGWPRASWRGSTGARSRIACQPAVRQAQGTLLASHQRRGRRGR